MKVFSCYGNFPLLAVLLAAQEEDNGYDGSTQSAFLQRKWYAGKGSVFVFFGNEVFRSRDERWKILCDRQLQSLAHHLGVKGAGGFVEQDHVRVHGQRAGDGYALLLTAGQALGVDVGLVGQTYAGQQLVCTGRDGLFVLQLEQGGCQLKVLFHSQVGEQVEVLEHHAHLLAHGVDVRFVHLHAFKLDRAGGGGLQPVQAAHSTPVGAISKVENDRITLYLSADCKKTVSGTDGISNRIKLAKRLVSEIE